MNMVTPTFVMDTRASRPGFAPKNKWKAAIFFAAIATLPTAAFGSQLSSFEGTFAGDDSIELFSISLGPDSSLTAETFGYAGGTDGSGEIIPSGGFDPALALFDPDGNLIEVNDNGGCGTVAADPTTEQCLDAYLSQPDLTVAGIYTLALTESPNLAQDNFGLPDTFPDPPGTGDFTCDDYGGTPDSAFCDFTGDQRDGDWEVDISGSNVISAEEVITPEPVSSMLLLVGLGSVVVLRRITDRG